MNNYDIRCAIQQARLHHYEIAAVLGINEGTFSRWLRNELPEDKKQKVLDAIKNLSR